jgi:type I restriction enzyme, S subunit
MSIKRGYKMTEVGVIPEDWQVRNLGELAAVKDGTHQTPQYVPFGIPFYSVEHVTKNDFTNTKYISESEHKFLTRTFKIEMGDILMTRIGSIGHCKLVTWNIDASFYVSLALLKIHDKRSAGFIAQYSNSDAFQREIDLRSLQSAIPRKINLGPISDVRIALPPLPEQTAIAQTLSDVDALIEALSAMLAKKRDIKQATMQQLLTARTRLPGFSGEWVIRKLGEVAPLQRGFDLPTSQILLGNFPVVYSNGILNFHHKSQVKGPGVVTGRSGTIGRVSFIENDFWPHNTTLWVTNFQGNDPKFVFYIYTHTRFVRFASGSGVPTLNRNDAHTFELFLPILKTEQLAIAQTLTDLDAELTALEARIEKTRALKLGMMQELLTGRTRLI